MSGSGQGRHAGRWVLLVGLLLTALGCSAPTPTETLVRGDLVFVDRLYPPGQGPVASTTFSLLNTYPQRIWLTGVDVAVKDDGTDVPVSGLLTGLSVGFQDAERHRQLNEMSGMITPSLFHTGDGLSSIRLPKGYGIPVMSNELLAVNSVWQNRDLYRKPLKVRADVALHFTPDPSDPNVVAPLKELRVYPVYVTVPATPASGEGKTPRAYDTSNLRPDADGKPAAGRWWIPSGPSRAASLVSYELPAEAELAVRLVTAFTYENWTRLELTDLTAQKSLMVFEPGDKTMSKEFPEGLKLDTRHQLSLSVSYDNPSRIDHVGIAMMVMYCDPVADP